MPLRPRRLHRPAAAVLVAALAVAGCDAGVASPSPSATAGPASRSPTATQPPTPGTSGAASPDASAAPPTGGDLDELYTEINREVQALRGLEEEEPVEPEIVSREEMGEILGRIVREETPPEQLEAYQNLYRAMGLLPAGERLEDVYVELLETQVGGLYVPEQDLLYVVSKAGGVGAVERVLYVHEYEHALQDQHFDLGALQSPDLVDQTDRQMALQSLIEGDAYVVMTYWLQQSLGPFEILEFMNSANDPAAMEALEKIPPIVSSQFMFAATYGLRWVLGIQSVGGWEAVDEVFADPPDSTEQILHPDKWASREAPVEVELPGLEAGLPGWSVALEDTFGEHQLGVWVEGGAGTASILPEPPPPAVVGWGGDRVAYLEGPDGAWAVVVLTEWDTPADAAEFEAAVKEVLPDADGPGRVLAGDGAARRSVVIGSDAESLATVTDALAGD